MLISILGSGSKGNSAYIKVNNTHILIDVGFTLIELERRLEFSIDKIDYILITHAHSDHIKGLKQITKRYNVNIIISETIKEELEYLDKYENIIYLKEKMLINDINILVIKTSHDTESYGFLIEYNSKSLVYITDTGYINNRYFDILKDKSMYVIESNHDIELLMNGKYPSFLKSRVMSDYGHLSNSMAAFYLSKFIGDKTQKIVLAHLSEDNNSEYLAINEVKDTFNKNQITFDDIHIAKQDEVLNFRI